MRIAVCDDDIKDIHVLRSHINTHQKNHEIVEFISANPLLKRLYDGEHFDLLFLDIQMPDSNGWEIAKALKQSNVKTYIAMITIKGNYIYDCFDRVDWFAQKPVSEERVHKILDNACARLFPKVFSFQAGKITITLTAPEIIYAEIKINDLYIYTTNGCHKTRVPLKEFEKTLSAMNCFVRIHQSFIINLYHFQTMDKNEITLKNGSVLTVSKKYRGIFYDSLEEYIRNG